MHKNISTSEDSYAKMVWLLRNKQFKGMLNKLKRIKVKRKRSTKYVIVLMWIGGKHLIAGDIFLLERVFPTLFGAFEELSEEIEDFIDRSNLITGFQATLTFFRG